MSQYTLMQRIKLWRLGLERKPWERYKVFLPFSPDYFTEGCVKITFTKMGACRWAKKHFTGKRSWRVDKMIRGDYSGDMVDGE